MWGDTVFVFLNGLQNMLRVGAHLRVRPLGGIHIVIGRTHRCAPTIVEIAQDYPSSDICSSSFFSILDSSCATGSGICT